MADFEVSVGGEVYVEGAVNVRNPAWLVVDSTLRWMGEWSVGYGYDQSDAVLYRAASTETWHIFVSKAPHNTGNIPDSSSAWWRRVYQEPWR